MGRRAASIDERKEQRDRIRRAAANLYDEGGLPALSVRAIARRAGVSTGLLYSYFADMSDLMRSLWLRPVGEFADEVAAIVESESDPLVRIEQLLGAYVAWVHRHPEVHRGVLLFVRPPTGDTLSQQPVDQLALPRALRSAVIEGQKTATIRAGDPDELAQVLWAGVHGALALPINLDRWEFVPPDELATAMIDTLVASLTA